MAAPAPLNVVSRCVTDDLITYSGETAVPRYMKFFLDQKIAESPMGDEDEVYDSLLAAKDCKRCEESKLVALNDVIAETLNDIDTQVVNVEILDGFAEVAESSRLPDKMNVVFNRARSEEKSFVGLMQDLCFSLRISLSKNRRLVAELEALVEKVDSAKPLEQMREIVARDSVTLGDLEKLLARALVGVSLKDGYIDELEEKE
ncbi:hypothetical protein Tco_0899562 [Tanacetum coccineum]